MKQTGDHFVDPAPLLRESLHEQLQQLRLEKESAFGLRRMAIVLKIGFVRMGLAFPWFPQSVAHWLVGDHQRSRVN